MTDDRGFGREGFYLLGEVGSSSGEGLPDRGGAESSHSSEDFNEEAVGEARELIPRVAGVRAHGRGYTDCELLAEDPLLDGVHSVPHAE